MQTNRNNTDVIITGNNYYQDALRELTIFDDIFMRKVLESKECTQVILQIILDKEDLKVEKVIVQKDFKNLQVRSAILDCVATDSTGKLYNIEIQRASRGAGPKRARYHSSLLDINQLKPREDFDKLRESHVIFITEEDVLGEGRQIYHIDRTIRESGNMFGDESHIIYVDSSKQDDTKLGRLLQDLHCKTPSNFNNEILKKRVSELKETQEGEGYMRKELRDILDFYSRDIAKNIANDMAKDMAKEAIEAGREEGIKAGREEGREEGREAGIAWMATNLYKSGISIESISQMAGVSTEIVEKWLNLQAV